MNHYSGFVEFLNYKPKLYERKLTITNNKYLLLNSTLKRLPIETNIFKDVLFYHNTKYFIKTERKNSKTYLQTNRKDEFASLLTNSYNFLTGGKVFYDHFSTKYLLILRNKIPYYRHYWKRSKKNVKVLYQTLIWIGEETYKVNCEQNVE